jgi:PDZ domain-containing protein
MDKSQVSAPRARGTVLRRIERIVNVLSIIAIVVLIALFALWHIPSGYQVELPATAQPVAPKISVAGHPPRTGGGQFYMTFVSEPDTNLLEQLYGSLNPDASLVPLPPHFSASQYQQQTVQMMLTSQQTAELVALCHLGYKLCNGGVLVYSIEPYSKVGKLLQQNDVIVSLDGTAVMTPDALKAALSMVQPGATVTLGLVRNQQHLTVRVPTVKSPTAPHGTALGITIEAAPPLNFPSKLPVDVKIDAGNIAGPSAGLMFTLGILERLSPTDLTHGYKIAGTGTINIDGSVGAIGGVKQKVIGAEWAGAKYFIVPYDGGNYTDAEKAVKPGMTLVPVHNLDDALKFLNSLQAK